MRKQLRVDELTDELILEFGRRFRDATQTGSMSRHVCVIALGLAGPGHGAASVDLAKRQICAAINAGNRGIS